MSACFVVFRCGINAPRAVSLVGLRLCFAFPCGKARQRSCPATSQHDRGPTCFTKASSSKCTSTSRLHHQKLFTSGSAHCTTKDLQPSLPIIVPLHCFMGWQKFGTDIFGELWVNPSQASTTVFSSAGAGRRRGIPVGFAVAAFRSAIELSAFPGGCVAILFH